VQAVPPELEITYAFRFDPWFERVARPLGVRPDSTSVALGDDDLEIEFGPWHLTTPIRNVMEATVTGPYSWPKVIGPPHVSLADGGLSFATNAEAGACIRLNEPIRGSTPLPFPRHGAITVTVADPESLAEAIEAVTAAPDQSLVEVTEDLALDLSGASASQLRERARELGLRGVSSMRKAELVDVLRPHLPGEEHDDEPAS
jgi:hypothetical protein